MKDSDTQVAVVVTRPVPRWLPMSVRLVGTVTGMVQGGTGKLSVNFADSGDIRKPKPTN